MRERTARVGACGSRCPRQESNLVLDLRRVVCDSVTPRGRFFPRPGVEPGLAASKTAVPSATLAGGAMPCPCQESNLDFDLRRVACRPSHSRGVRFTFRQGRRPDSNRHGPVYKTGAFHRPRRHRAIEWSGEWRVSRMRKVRCSADSLTPHSAHSPLLTRCAPGGTRTHDLLADNEASTPCCSARAVGGCRVARPAEAGPTPSRTDAHPWVSLPARITHASRPSRRPAPRPSPSGGASRPARTGEPARGGRRAGPVDTGPWPHAGGLAPRGARLP